MATSKQNNVAKILLENPGMSVSEAMKKAKYKPGSYKNPQDLTRSKGFRQLVGDVFSPVLKATKINQLLNASRIDHMVFPLSMTDEDISNLLAQANCKVKRFMHSETQTHVWFFAADNMAQDKALEKLLKISGDYAPEEHNVNHGWSLSDLFDKAQKKKDAKK